MGCCYSVKHPEGQELTAGLDGFEKTVVLDHLRGGVLAEKKNIIQPEPEIGAEKVIDEDEENDLRTLELPNPTSEFSLTSWKNSGSPQNFKVI